MQTLEKRPRRLASYWDMPFDKFFRNDFLDFWDSGQMVTIPSVNLSEEKDKYLIEVAAPGLQKEDFNISVDANVLTISCEKESETKENETDKYSRREYNYSSFMRKLTLPDLADSNSILAKYNDGVLKLTISKKPETKKEQRHKIKVQ
ncbi:MAG: Hsp20/alpha crystallin family protein [Bacteroidia bacterium]